MLLLQKRNKRIKRRKQQLSGLNAAGPNYLRKGA
jgi:hypothetical protein